MRHELRQLIAFAIFIALSPLSQCAKAEYTLPTFEPDPQDFHVIPALAPEQTLDVDAIFNRVVGCYPKPSAFQLQIDGIVRIGTGSSDDIYNLDITALGKYYVGVVARMPLFSTREIERSIQREAEIRLEIAKHVANLAQGVAESRLAHRELGLYSSLESRSQARVKTGFADVDEQVSYLQKTLDAHRQVTASTAKVNMAKVALVSLCQENKRTPVETYLEEILK